MRKGIFKFMPEDIESSVSKAWVFFSKAQKVADTNNFDYAIDLYLEGLRCAPDALDEGHLKLYALALHRQGKNGKKPSMMERVKYLHGRKTALEEMLDAEYLFAKAPDNLGYLEAMLKAALAGGYENSAKWMADLAFQINNNSPKPSLNTYLFLKDSYASIGLYERAIAACQHACRLKPDNQELSDELKHFSAEMTVSRGKYDYAEDFRASIKGRKEQEELQSQEGVVKTKEYRLMALEEARKALAKEPDIAQNILNLAQVLSEFENENEENESIELLDKAYKEKSDFSFKQRSGRIQIKQLRRKIRKLNTKLQSEPNDKDTKALLGELTEKLKQFELEHYRLCSENYPTDPQIKYEYGVRLILNKKYDEAIPLFQDAQKDPRHKIASMGKIGFCFFKKGWYADAIDLYKRAIEAYEIKDDGISKELRYNLGRSYEEHGETEKSLEIYRRIAQIDFGYKDVRERVDKLRNNEN